MASAREFDSAAAEREAKRMEEAASMLRRISAHTESALETASRSWKGVHSDSYRRKGETLRTELQTSERQLLGMAGRVREVIREMERLEAENSRIASSR